MICRLRRCRSLRLQAYSTTSSGPKTKLPPLREYQKPNERQPQIKKGIVVEATPIVEAAAEPVELPIGQDPERGARESERVAQGGKLDDRYKPASRRILAIIVALPIAIVFGWELTQRRFMGKIQKQPPKPKALEQAD